MKTFNILTIIASVFAALTPFVLDAKSYSNTGAETDAVAVIWPAYQDEPRWKELGIFAHGCGEWQNVYEGKPRFDGHYQPMQPLWGYGRDDDPIEVARQLDAALAAGINVFMYDWYWYCGRPFLENALNNGFLKAPNNERMHFYLMWANHHVTHLWNNKIATDNWNDPIWRAWVDYDEFTKVLVPRWISYFKKPNYYKIDNKPVFMIYLVNKFVEGVGGVENAKKALAYFRAEVKKAGFAGLHLQIAFYPWQKPFAVEGDGGKPSWAAFHKYLGVDSATCYNWEPLVVDIFNTYTSKDNIEYEKYGACALSKFDETAAKLGVPLLANISIGWDNNARYPLSKTTKTTVGKSPELYGKFLRQALQWTDKHNPDLPRFVLINAWNEWTEGGYLMPDKKFGYGYLNETAKVLSTFPARSDNPATSSRPAQQKPQIKIKKHLAK